ncbi:tripartite tricarboxylate transporter substrate binding protein [Ahrensia sp. R2A130]|uniref:tripartite tricarboxylate transporter substrate binding protein n=1 Tax=Ahrensia sp. R2A130 TaxID=744979 RepID=UPI0001E09448|nr:tripartite tricarboxylate transporter substrate binding protein [Ahrensia sp. R2A130]EFL89579.1 putative secreted protein [Ahrensia sp. R2A130]
MNPLARFAATGLLAVTASLSISTAMAEEHSPSFPDRPILLSVSYGPGGATDYQARIVTIMAAQDEMLGQPIAIINKPGAGGRKGWNWFATQAKTDGYTWAAYNVPHFIAQSIRGGVRYAPGSFEPIANWGADPAVFVVKTSSQFQSMDDVIAFARANPGQLSTSGAGLLVGHHIAALQIEKSCRCRLAYRPASGGGVAALDAVSDGKVMAGINNMSDAIRAENEGEVRILAIADIERHSFLPNVPTLRETGLDVDNTSVNYRGIMVPKGTPDEVIEELAAAVPNMFAHPKVEKLMKNGGAPMQILGREEVQELWTAREKVLRRLFAKVL